MYDKIKNYFSGRQAKQLLDMRNIVLYIFCLTVLAIAWSGAKTVQNNYELQKQIAALKQQNQIIALQNANTTLQNEFYKTDEYLELSARQNLGLAAPGEKVLVIPKSVALKYVDQSLVKKPSNPTAAAIDNRSKYTKNLEAWRDFLLGRGL